ncbi:MAG: cysteine desulfurase NifS [Clostridia bacterium]|nr:cysteine desulfurase NifS [Clostridia bacterium]
MRASNLKTRERSLNLARFVYADNAATTPVSRQVLDAMLPCFLEDWGNPSSLHEKGRDAKDILDDARARVAAVLGADASEIYFTSGGTESDNWAIRGAAMRLRAKGKNRIVTSKIEHHAVLHTCEALAKEGFEVVYVGVDEDGVVKLDELRASLNDKTAIVSIMYANNEVGTIQPVEEIGNIAHEFGALFHTDAVQAVGQVDIDLSKLPVDMLSLSGHKLHAPKGIGALYIRRGVVIGNLIEGGGQEKRKRGGTENLPYIVGLAKAMEIAKEKLKDLPRVAKMRDKLIEELTKIPYSKLNGHRTKRLPGNANIGFEFIEGESMLLWLDIAGVCASTGSACSSASLDPSHVLLAMGVPHERAHGSLRLSISHDTTDEDIDYIIETLPPIIEKLRNMSPLWEDVVKKEGARV